MATENMIITTYISPTSTSTTSMTTGGDNKAVKCMPGDFMVFVDNCGKEIFIASAVVITILILIVGCLLIVVSCLAPKYRRLSRQYASTANETDSAMYSTVEEIPVTDSRTKKDHTSGNGKGQNDLTVDADNYDIITLEGIGHSAKASGKTSKDMKKSKTVSEEKSAGPTETFSPLAEYAVPDKAQKSKKQTSKANLAPAADDKLLPVTSTAQPHLSVHPSQTFVYTNISPDNFKRKSTSMLEPDNNQRQKRGRTSSPPEEPPPLPPPFVDDNSVEVSGANVKLQSDITTALKQKKLGGSSNVNKTDNENAGAFYRSEVGVSNEVVDAWPLYDDIEGVAGPQPPQEMYMNVKR